MTRTLSFALFSLVGTSLTVGIHYFLWSRLVRDTRLPAPWSTVVTATLIGLAALMPLTMFVGRLLWPALGRVLAWPAFIWMGVMFLLFLLLLAAEIIKVAVLWSARLLAQGENPVSPERRELLAQGAAAVAFTTAAVAGVVGVRRVAEGAQVKTVEVTLPQLPAELDGFTLAQLSDVHIGVTIGKGDVDHLVHNTNAFKPDLVAITGDLVDGSVEDLAHAVGAFSGLKSRHGTFFVTGNHEYYSGADEWIEEVRRLGWRVLRNERVAIQDNGQQFDLAGVDDFSSAAFGNGHGPDLARAVAGRDVNQALVLMAHQPREAERAAQAGVGLQLSGHTHGGQIWPWHQMVKLQTPYVAGLYRHEESPTQVYVNAGSGYWGPPMRLGTTSEITRVILRSPQRLALGRVYSTARA